MALPLDDDDPQICYPPTPVLPEWYVDLDLQLLCAAEAAASLTAAAESMATYRFVAFPRYQSSQPDFGLMGGAASCLAVENHRRPLRNDLAGAGNTAGSAEFNPYVEAIFRLELATHRRLYRLFYGLCRHVGFDVAVEPMFASPDDVERQGL